MLLSLIFTSILFILLYLLTYCKLHLPTMNCILIASFFSFILLVILLPIYKINFNEINFMVALYSAFKPKIHYVSKKIRR